MVAAIRRGLPWVDLGRSNRCCNITLFLEIRLDLKSRDEAGARISADSFQSSSVPLTRFEPTSIESKTERHEIVRKLKRERGQRKLQSSLAITKAEITDPAARGGASSSISFPRRSAKSFDFGNGWRRMSQRLSTTKGSSTLPS